MEELAYVDHVRILTTAMKYAQAVLTPYLRRNHPAKIDATGIATTLRNTTPASCRVILVVLNPRVIPLKEIANKSPAIKTVVNPKMLPFHT